MTPKKSLEELTLLDRFLFAEVMEDKENLQILLEIILGKDVPISQDPQTEKEIRRSTQDRTVRLDVWTIDDLHQVYDAEVQKIDTHNLPKRSRLYQGLIDSHLMPPGSIDFNMLNPVFIILIAPFDLFGKGRYQYSFENRCIEDPSIRLNDNAMRIFLNTRGTNDHEVSPELVELLHYMENTNNKLTLHSDRIKTLQEHVVQIQHDAERGVRYMQAWEEKVLEQTEAFLEGEAIGLEKGETIGLEEGEAIGLKKGENIGLEKGILGTVLSLRSFHIADADICSELMTRYQLSEERAAQFLREA